MRLVLALSVPSFLAPSPSDYSVRSCCSSPQKITLPTLLGSPAWCFSNVEKLSSLQAFILTQQKMNNQYRNVDMRAGCNPSVLIEHIRRRILPVVSLTPCTIYLRQLQAGQNCIGLVDSKLIHHYNKMLSLEVPFMVGFGYPVTPQE